MSWFEIIDTIFDFADVVYYVRYAVVASRFVADPTDTMSVTTDGLFA